MRPLLFEHVPSDDDNDGNGDNDDDDDDDEDNAAELVFSDV